MRALSLRQPWAWAVLFAHKRVENRDWTTAPAWMVGRHFFLHAATGCGREEFSVGVEAILSTAEPTPGPERVDFLRTLAFLHVPTRGKRREGQFRPVGELPFGALVGRARLADVIHTTLGGHRIHRGEPASRRCCLLCGEDRPVALVDRSCPEADPWAMPGAMGFLLDDVAAADVPIPCKGEPGFFDVPDEFVSEATWRAAA